MNFKQIFKSIELELGVWEGQGSHCSQNRGREKKECRETSKDEKLLLFKSPTEYWSTYVCEEAIQKNHSKEQRRQVPFLTFKSWNNSLLADLYYKKYCRARGKGYQIEICMHAKEGRIPQMVNVKDFPLIFNLFKK